MNYLETDSGRVMLDRYLSAKSAASRKGYKSEVTLNWLSTSGASVEMVNGPVLDRYRRFCSENGAAPASMKRKFSMISGFMKYLQKTTKGKIKAPIQKRGELIQYSAGRYVDSESFNTLLAGFRALQNARNSSKAYGNAVRQFFGFIDKQPGAVEMADLFAWKIHLNDIGVKTATIRVYFSGLKAFFNYLKARNKGVGFAVDLPGLSLKSPPRKSDRDIFDRSEMASLLSCMADKGDLLGVRDFALFKMIYEQGLRISEAANFRISDIRSTSGPGADEKAEIRIRDRKRGPSTTMIMESETLAAIRHWMRSSGYSFSPDSPVFLPLVWVRERGYEIAEHAREKRPLSTATIQKRFHVWMKQAGIDPQNRVLNCHSIRHSRATHMIESGAPIYELMEFLGHKKIETTQIYLHSIRQTFEKHVGMYR